MATALELPLTGEEVRAEGDLTFTAHFAVDKTAPVEFKTIRLAFDLEGDLSHGAEGTIQKLTERYCVVYRTLRNAPAFEVQSN